MNSEKFDARFRGRCVICGDRIEPGDRVVVWAKTPIGRRALVHDYCAAVPEVPTP